MNKRIKPLIATTLIACLFSGTSMVQAEESKTTPELSTEMDGEALVEAAGNLLSGIGSSLEDALESSGVLSSSDDESSLEEESGLSGFFSSIGDGALEDDSESSDLLSSEGDGTLEDDSESSGLLSPGGEDPLWDEPNQKSEREEIVEFALQFVGNPYVWGGTSLTGGADCSGFVLSVLGEFGYSLPRVAVDQYNASTKKDIADLEPGDLVFYGGDIHHVALYIGDGQIVHAANSRLGIIISDVTWESPAFGGTYLE